MGQEPRDKNPQIVASSRDFFCEIVADAVQSRRIQAPISTQTYLVNLLEHFIKAGNLFEDGTDGPAGRTPTMAELYLKAASAEVPVKVELLKRLGDSSLYISGFFGDSLERKLVDIDYYAGIGGSAYEALASATDHSGKARTYLDLSSRFLDYVEVLTYISQKSLVQTDADLLRLYSRYMATGSKLAEEQLIEKGVITPALTKAKQ